MYNILKLTFPPKTKTKHNHKNQQRWLLLVVTDITAPFAHVVPFTQTTSKNETFRQLSCFPPTHKRPRRCREVLVRRCRTRRCSWRRRTPRNAPGGRSSGRRATRCTAASGGGTPASGCARCASPIRRPGFGWGPFSRRRWRRVRTTWQRSRLGEGRPVSISPTPRTGCRCRRHRIPGTFRRRRHRLQRRFGPVMRPERMMMRWWKQWRRRRSMTKKKGWSI